MSTIARAADQILRWFSLAVTDRRWAAPLTGMALGFGIFVGIAVGPQAQGSLATSAPMIVQVEEPAPQPPPAAAAESSPSERPSRSGGGAASGSQTASEAGATVPDAPAITPPVAVSPPIPAVPDAAEVSTSPTETADDILPDGEVPDQDAEQQDDEVTEEGQVLTGTVAHVNPAAGSYALAAGDGTVSAIHARRLPDAGDKLAVEVRQLANGTYGGEGKRDKLGHKGQVKLAGTVTFVDPTAESPTYTLSDNGASLLIHLARGSAAESLPEVGDVAAVKAGIVKRPDEAPAETGETTQEEATAGGCQAGGPTKAPRESKTILRERSFDSEGEPSTLSDIAGVVAAVCPGDKQILLSADDVRESGHDMALSVPAGVDTDVVKPGESAVATVEIAGNGSMTLSGLASDERRKGAEKAGLGEDDQTEE